MNWKNELIKFNRINLMKGYDAKPMYAYDARGDFRHGYAALRICKNDNGWVLKVCREDEFKFENYSEGFGTKREAIEYASDRLN